MEKREISSELGDRSFPAPFAGGGDEQHGVAVVHGLQGAVLELAGKDALAVGRRAGDLLELQCALQGDGVRQAVPQEVWDAIDLLGSPACATRDLDVKQSRCSVLFAHSPVRVSIHRHGMLCWDEANQAAQCLVHRIRVGEILLYIRLQDHDAFSGHYLLDQRGTISPMSGHSISCPHLPIMFAANSTAVIILGSHVTIRH